MQLLTLSEQDWPLLRLNAQQTSPTLATLDNYWIIWRDIDRVTNSRTVGFEEYNSLLYFLHGETLSQLCLSLLEAHAIEEVPILALATIKS